MINHVEKLWGSEDWICNTDKYCAKFLNLKRGFACSLHYHKEKDETFYVLEGTVHLTTPDIDGRTIGVLMQAGDSIRIKPLTPHRFTSITPTAKILEVSTTHKDEDTIRIEDSKEIKD